MFKDLIVVERKGLMVTPALEGTVSTGMFTVVTKSRSGFPTVSQVKADSAYLAFRKFQAGSVLNVSMVNIPVLTVPSSAGVTINPLRSTTIKSLNITFILRSSSLPPYSTR
jgi:hypothetical protein